MNVENIPTCKNYCGVTCVNGECPNTIADVFGYMRIDCRECPYNEGCKDCCFYKTEFCDKGVIE